MAKAHKGKHLEISSNNVRGEAASVYSVLEGVNVNVHATCMIAPPGEDVRFWFVVDDFDKASAALKEAGYTVKTKNVILVAMAHRVGAYADVLRQVADAGVDVHMSYSSTAVKKSVLVVMETSSNARAMNVINGVS